MLPPKMGKAELVPPHVTSRTKPRRGVSFPAKDLPKKHLGEPDPRVWQEQDAEMREENDQ